MRSLSSFVSLNFQGFKTLVVVNGERSLLQRPCALHSRRQVKVPCCVLEVWSPLTWSREISAGMATPQKELYAQGRLNQVNLQLCPAIQNKTALECSWCTRRLVHIISQPHFRNTGLMVINAEHLVRRWHKNVARADVCRQNQRREKASLNAATTEKR